MLALPISVVRAQKPTLVGRSTSEVNAGMWGGASVTNAVSSAGVRTSADANSFLAGLVYAYGLREDAF
jgi:hypothetical protein